MKKMWKNNKKYIIPILLILFSFSMSYLLLCKLNMPIFLDDSNLTTHYGLFLGFGLTIYTFIISILDNIVERIDNNKKIKRKEEIIEGIFSGINHLKHDVFGILLIFISHILVLGCQNLLIEICVNVEIIKQGLFIYSIFILLDITNVLFGIADISLSLIKNRKEEEGEEKK